MRALVFFDLPRTTSAESSVAARFVRDLRKEGFIMLQESVYCKLLLDKTAYDGTRARLERMKPKKGNVILLTVTERQFASAEYLVGEYCVRDLAVTDRVVIL